MTHLTIAQQPTDEFSILGQNSNTGRDDCGLIFYDDVTRVHVTPDRENITIQVLTPDVAFEMDFPDAGSARHALGLFEAKRVSEVSPEVPSSVRITPITEASKDFEQKAAKVTARRSRNQKGKVS